MSDEPDTVPQRPSVSVAQTPDGQRGLISWEVVKPDAVEFGLRSARLRAFVLE